MTKKPRITITTKGQALRAFRALAAACDMSARDYIEALLRIGEIAKDFADDELIVQRIYAIDAREQSWVKRGRR